MRFGYDLFLYVWPSGPVLHLWFDWLSHPTWNAWESADFVEEDLRAQLREMEAGASKKDKVEAPNGILGFLKWGYPKMDGLYMKNRLKMDDFGIPPISGNLHMICLSSSNLSMYQQHVQERQRRLRDSKFWCLIFF